MSLMMCPITKHLVDMVRLGIDPFTRAEIDEIRRAEDYHDMTYIDENNRVRYLISRGLVDEDILDLLYSHGYISANQMAATINQTRRTDDNRSN
jgi:hypothetical protein